jgi:hypothetical protein
MQGLGPFVRTSKNRDALSFGNSHKGSSARPVAEGMPAHNNEIHEEVLPARDSKMGLLLGDVNDAWILWRCRGIDA